MVLNKSEKLGQFLDSIHFDKPEYGDDWEDVEETYFDPDDEEEGEFIEKAFGEDIKLSTKAIVYNDQDEFLILKDSTSDFWDLPGGHVADGEATNESLVREVKEETQLELENVEELFTREIELGNELKAVIFYVAKGYGHVGLSDEHTKHKWVTLGESKEYNLGIFHTILKEIFKEEKYHGGIVTFPVPEKIAKYIAFEGFEEPKKLHVTLAYIPYGEYSKPEWFNVVQNAILKVGIPPMTGEIIGLRRFFNVGTEKNQDAIVARVTIPGIHSWRMLLQKYMDETDLKVSEEHPFNPHITLAYINSEQTFPVYIRPLKVNFDNVAIWMDDEHYDIEFEEHIKKSFDFDSLPDFYSEECYDWIDNQLNIQKAGVTIGGNQPRGTKKIGKQAETSLYNSLQDKVDNYLDSLSGSETQDQVLEGVRKALDDWKTNNLPLIKKTFEELFRRGLQAGVMAGGGILDRGDKLVLDLLRNSDYRLGSSIELFVEETATRYSNIIKEAFGPNQEFNLKKLVGDMDQAVPADRFKLERIARTEVGQTAGLGRFWGWEQKAEEKYSYEYFWNSTPDNRRRKMKELRSASNPYTYDEIWFLWTHNKQYVPGVGWQMGAINCRCTASRSPVEKEFVGNRFKGQEGRFERTLDVKMPWDE